MKNIGKQVRNSVYYSVKHSVSDLVRYSRYSVRYSARNLVSNSVATDFSENSVRSVISTSLHHLLWSPFG